MADWKANKGLGPWPFLKQRNKWAYLNNPRWQPQPRAFRSGGPDDYDGRESQEPQLFTPEHQPPYSSGTEKIHHQCGHWHVPAPTPPTLAPTTFPPTENYHQQTIDVNVDTIAFVARPYGLLPPIKPNIGIEGDIVGAAINWYNRLSYMSNSADVKPCSATAPVRVIDRSPTSLVSYDQDANPVLVNAHIYGFGWHGGPEVDVSIWNEDEIQDYPFWEEFDMHSNGVALCITSTDNDGLRLKRSVNFGQTWSAPYEIDALRTILDALDPTHELYNWQWRYASGICLQCDEYTGNFYILTSYSDYDYGASYRWILLVSVDGGLSWSEVKTWDFVPLHYDTDMMSLAVSNGKIYCNFIESVGSYNTICYHSSNGGATWGDTNIGSGGWLNIFRVAANSSVAIQYTDASPWTDIHLFRSADNGATWSEVLHNSYSASEQVYYPTIRASGSTFVATFCNLRFPNNNGTWHGTDAIPHSMAEVDPSKLAFFMSRDNGLTWTLEVTPIDAT